MSVPQGSCLQCEESREAVKAEGLICGIVGGYEYRELEVEWERHHWRDWSDAELRGHILPEFYDQHRRDSASDLGYAPCEHTVHGHTYPKEPDLELGFDVNRCMGCGAIKVADEGTNHG